MDDEKRAMAMQVFKDLDSDGDGLLRRADLAEFIPIEDKLDEIMGVLDPNKTGSISFQDFLAGFDAFYGEDDDDDDDEEDSGDGDDDDEVARHLRSLEGPPGISGAKRGSGIRGGRRASVTLGGVELNISPTSSLSPPTPSVGFQPSIGAGPAPSPGSRKSRVRRGSITEALMLEQLNAPKDFQAASGKTRGDAVKNFEHSKTSQPRNARFTKILDWCQQAVVDGESVSLQELDMTMRYLARAFTESEISQMTALLQEKGFSAVTAMTLQDVLKAAVEGDRARSSWNPEAFVTGFVSGFKRRVAEDPSAGTMEEEKNIIAELEERVRALERAEETARNRYKKLQEHTSAIDEENTKLRKEMGVAEGGLKKKQRTEGEMEEELAANKALLESYITDVQKLNKQVSDLETDNNNANAMLQVEQKIKKSAMSELETLRDTVTGLRNVRSEQNKLDLVKKLGRMKSVQESRKYQRSLQVKVDRTNALEGENARLKELVERLQAEAAEYLRLMDSYREGASNNPLDLPQRPAGDMAIGFALKDDAELEELRRKLAQALKELAEEKELREQVERELDVCQKELATTKEELAVERVRREELEKEVEDLRAQLEAANARIAELEAELAAALAEIDKLKQQLEEALARIKELEDENARLKKELEDALARIKLLEEQLALLGNDNDKRLQELMEEIERLKKRIKELEEELAREKALREQLEAKVSELENLLSEERAKSAKLEEMLAEAHSEIERLKQALAESETERKRLEDILRGHEMEIVTILEAKEKIVMEAPVAAAPKIGISLTPEQQAEVTAYAICMNNHLRNDLELAHIMPINVETPELLVKVCDGLLLSKFVNCAVQDTIDERALNHYQKAPLDDFAKIENINLMIMAAKSIGVVLPADSASIQKQLLEVSDPQVSIDFLYELIKTRYFTQLSLRESPELIEIAETPPVGLSSLRIEELEMMDLKSLSPNNLLMRWTNWMTLAGATATMSGLIKEYKTLANDNNMFFFLSRIAEAMEKPIRPNEGRTDAQKARHNLEAASALGVQHFHRANNFSNERLCQLFAAVVFSTHTGFADDMMHGKDGASRDGGGLDSDSREERAFRMWINSCGIPGVFLNNLFLDCRDGLALLKVEDYIEKGVVNWRKVEMKPNNKFKCVGNCGYAVNIGKDKPLNFSLVSIDGADIYDGNEKLILALVWQLMRFHVLKQLMALGGGKALDDTAIMKWANAKISGKKHDKCTTSLMRSFQDKGLSDSTFLINLIYIIEPRVVDWRQVQGGNLELSAKDKIRNAGYAISVARKLGAEIFLLPHDIVECKPKMMMLFIGSLMQLESTRNKA